MCAVSLKQYEDVASKCPDVDFTVDYAFTEVAEAMMGLKRRLVSLHAFALWNDEGIRVTSENNIEALRVAAATCFRRHELSLKGETKQTRHVLHALAPQLQTFLQVLKIQELIESRHFIKACGTLKACCCPTCASFTFMGQLEPAVLL